MDFENDYYVIDKDFKIVSFNKPVEQRYKGIKAGDFCYKATMNRESPCLHCPIAGNSDNSNPIYFDPFYNDWVQANFCKLDDDKFGVVCYKAEITGFELLNDSDYEKLKLMAPGKAVNDVLKSQVSKMSQIIQGLSAIFTSVAIIDIKKQYCRSILSDFDDSTNEDRKFEGFLDIIVKKILETRVAAESQEAIQDFFNMETVDQRMGNKKSISCDYLDIKKGWSRTSFFPMERDEKGKLTKILVGARIIQADFIDPLTKCYVRRALDWAYNSKYNSSKSIALLVCDVNGLKSINDEEGHPSGDEYICNVAASLGEYFGFENIYRIGGDEFIVLTLDVKQNVFSRRVMEFKKQAEIEKLNISIGYEFREKFDVPFEEILADADAKMYEAKREYYRKKGINWGSGSETARLSEYLESLVDYGSLNYMVCKINLTTNEYRIIHTMEGYDTSFTKYCKTLQDLLFFPATTGVVHKDDLDDFLKYSDINFLRNQAKINKGKLEHWIRYRSNYNKKEYRVAEAQFFSSREYTDDNQICYAYLKDMGVPFSENRVLLSEVLKELSGNFESVYYINFDRNTVYPYRTNDIIAKRYSEYLDGIKSYEELVIPYIETFVAEREKQAMLKFCDKKNLEAMLKVKKAVTYDYKAVVDGNEIFYRVKFANMEGAGELHHCVLGISNINLEKLALVENTKVKKGSSITNIEKDGLTGLYSKEAFFRYAQTILDTNPGKDYLILVSNIVGFKVINEKYGQEKGDQVLKYVAKTGPEQQQGYLLGGRINSDIFVSIRTDSEMAPGDENDSVINVQNNAPVPNLLMKFGLYYTKDNRNLTIQQMYDRAMLAMTSIKNEYGVFFAKYDDSMGKKMILNQKIIDNMENALKNEYFKVYYQPKFDIQKEKIAGAEALVRWIDPELGFMNPGDFIPVFENNGFITNLDRYIWRKVCEELAYLLSIEKAFPISINVSRKDFSDVELAQYLIDLTEEFNIPKELLHIEVTESAYSDNPEQMSKTIRMLHSNGFVIELDDFGSGYSSITALNSIDIDILKLDMSIIKSDVPGNGKSVLEFSMELAKMMKLKTIQEGVETKDQLSRVKELGCDYVQGFYFSKPLSKEDFEEFIKKH